jgi:transposase
MLSFPAAIKVYLCTIPCDMRRSFDGLSMMAEHVIGCNPFSGHLLVFCNRRSDRVKVLYWDRDGWAIWYKRLEVGTFQFPLAATGRKELAAWELVVLLEGIDLSQGKRRKRYSLPEGAGRTEERLAGAGNGVVRPPRQPSTLPGRGRALCDAGRYDGCLRSSSEVWNETRSSSV